MRYYNLFSIFHPDLNKHLDLPHLPSGKAESLVINSGQRSPLLSG